MSRAACPGSIFSSNWNFGDKINTRRAVLTTLCLKQVPTFKLSVTLSNLNRFSKFLHCWKAYEICYKPIRHYPAHLRHVATLPWDLKNSNFLQILGRCGKMQRTAFQCTNFNSSTCITVYVECIYVFWSKSGPHSWMPCWLLTNTAVTSAMMNFQSHRLIAK